MKFSKTGKSAYVVVTEEETGIEIGYSSIKWDYHRTRPFELRDGKMVVLFQAANEYSSKAQTALGKKLPVAVHIMEDSFKSNLMMEKKKVLGESLTDVEYQKYKEIVHQGMFVLSTDDSRVLQQHPNFSVIFEKSVESWLSFSDSKSRELE